MSTTDLTDDQLAARIRAACADRAQRLEVEHRTFEPGAPTPDGLPLAPARAPRRRLLLAAAAIVLIASVAAAIVLTRPDGSDELRTASTTVPSERPGSWLAPSSPPLGLDLRSVTWSTAPDVTGVRAQLFASRTGTARVLVWTQRQAGTPTGDPGPTVQGTGSRLIASKTGAGSRITWDAAGATIDAEYLGTDQAGAVALLDQLAPRTADHAAGFEVPDDGSVILVDEAEPGRASHHAELVYGEQVVAGSGAAAPGRSVTVTTTASSVPTVAQVEMLLVVDVEDVDPAEESYRYLDGDRRTLSIEGPGRAISITVGPDGEAPTAAEMDQIADGIVPIAEDGLRTLERQTRVGQPAEPSGTEPSTVTTGSDATTAVPATTPTTAVPLGPSESSAPLGVPVYRLDGSETTLAELSDGRLAIVVLWQPSCAPCISALQALDEVAAAHPDAVVIAVAVDASIDEVEAFADDFDVSATLVADPIGAVSSGWAVEGVPTAKVIGTDGEVLGSGLGGLGDFDEIDGFVREVLGS